MESKRTTRRDLLRLALGLGAVAGGWQLWLRRPRALDFHPIQGLPGWQQLVFDEVSLASGNATGAVFAGIGEGEAPAPLASGDLCALLYPGDAQAAFFTDINCPNCRSLAAKLAARKDDLNVTVLDLPLLGPGSEVAARALIAAEILGKGEALRSNLISPQHLDRAALAAGLEPETLKATMATPEIDRRLTLNYRAAETLVIYGTPALTIGRTLVMGDMPDRTLDRVIEIGMDTQC